MLSAVFCLCGGSMLYTQCSINEHFPDKADAKKLYNKSYFEAARRLEKRRLLSVNEHFPDKADAKRALLYNFLWNVVLYWVEIPISVR